METFKNILVLNETTSTNNYAMQLINEGGTENGSMVLSYYQKKGRGQRGNEWESTPGLNMLASIIVFPDFLNPAGQFYISKIVSIAIAEWLKPQTNEIFIKWPNDIYIRNKKIAGILIETSVMGSRLHSAVAGIGLNLNQTKFSENIPNPVSLKTVTGKDYDIKNTAFEIRELFMFWYKNLEKGEFDLIDKLYHKNLFRINEWALYKKNDKTFEARITGTESSGHLILEDRNGEKTNHMFKEVEFII